MPSEKPAIMPVPPAGSKVLVTGASGFLAVHVVHEALKAGFQVVGTVRSNGKGDYLKELFEKHYPGKFSYTIAEDLEAPGAFDEAVKGVQAVLHTASPFHFSAEGKALDALVNPAVNGTLSVLNSIKKNGTEVQRVVITSSYAAILDSTRTPPVQYTEKDWNESSPANSKRDGNNQDSFDAYRASKTLAERAAWDFVAKEKPQWDLSTINPPLVLGPILHQVEAPEKLNTSVANIWNLINGTGKQESDLPGAAGCSVDVRDAALAHVQAIKVAEAGGERFAPTIGKYTWQETVDVIHGAPWIPEETKAKVPKGKTGNTDVTQNNLSGAKTEKVLGIKYHNLQSTIEGEQSVGVLEAMTTLEADLDAFPSSKGTVGSLFEYQAREWKGAPALPAV